MPRLFTKNRIWLLIGCILLAILLFSFIPHFSSGIKNFSLKAFSIPIRACSRIGQYFSSKRLLVQENSFLHKRVGDLSLEVGQLKELSSENERLRALLVFKERTRFDTISAEVIARNPNDWIGSFVIDKGSEDGIRKNSAVCSAKGLLGKVTEPEARTSSVILITHPGFKAGGIIKDTRINGIVVGSGKGTARMLYIPIDAEVRKGEIVITSGFSRVFPKGITIGEIVSVGRSKTGLYKYAVIKPSANLFDQEEVLCIK
ncbi:MAG: rod shape-determining protein MreC [Candidatus Omnitrophota bacterium]